MSFLVWYMLCAAAVALNAAERPVFSRERIRSIAGRTRMAALDVCAGGTMVFAETFGIAAMERGSDTRSIRSALRSRSRCCSGFNKHAV